MSKQSTDADVAFIAALAELLNKNELTEISVKREYGEDDSLDVRVIKQANVVQVAAPAPVYAAAPPAPAAPASDCISTTDGTVPHRFGLWAAAQSSQYSAIGEAGVIG